MPKHSLGFRPTCTCYDSKYARDEYGQTIQGFIRTQSIAQERAQSRLKAQELYPDDQKAQKEYIHHIHEHGAVRKDVTTGWKATCGCQELESVPMRVLDPFCGSGTTGIVAKRLGLDFVGIDVKPVYADISRQRIEKAPGPDRQTELF